MTDTKDLREEILNEEHWKFVVEKGVSSVHSKTFPATYMEQAKIAMDEYFELRAMELLEYMGKNNIVCEDGRYNNQRGFDFKYKGEWITAKELFQNFL